MGCGSSRNELAQEPDEPTAQTSFVGGRVQAAGAIGEETEANGGEFSYAYDGSKAFRQADSVKTFFRGNQLMENGLFREAILAFGQAIQLKPDFATAFHERGSAYMRLMELDNALEDFSRAIELRPDYAIAYTSRGTAFLHKGEFQAAISDSTKAVQICPDDAGAFQLRAKAYTKTGQTEEAMNDYERAGLIEQKRLCVICLEQTRCTRLHPCLHSCMCSMCAKDLSSQGFPCPLCSQSIQQVEFGTFDNTWAFDGAFESPDISTCPTNEGEKLL
mmetsp:Transcript_842/g.2739  ORF Transcript_842/g.2739 Transcript_842/m.2739 type:complete len:275 (+) Transcript_842:323-1147(+)|eukprot:CAMPEP_0183819500 /NCGR_PEP_ID=MMETSP0803_2-20130417/64172_1 /TAXON_ID=195967 /ORGANISM="Crustomastix stigmata, Strain CCMP3273" /LENGTH=274 /DNA_ID=CAMNT_0026064389 /DNA_START=316 /DNA_END=1140 /DNA_ORIENTATION=+